MRLGDLEIDVEGGAVRLGPIETKVEPLVLRLIAFLAEKGNGVIMKEELVAEVWQGIVVSDSAITRAISLARRAIATEACPNPIRAVYGRGYQLQRNAGATRARADTASQDRAAAIPRDQRIMSFVGRQQETAAVGLALDRLATGGGALCLVTGEAGIGKTRFCENIADLADRVGYLALLGRCMESDGGAPSFWPWLQILRQLNPSPVATREDTTSGSLEDLIRDSSSSEQPRRAIDRHQLLDEASRYILSRSTTRPLLLVLDDLHRADEGSLSLLEFLAADLAKHPILILAAYREVELKRSTRLYEHLMHSARAANASIYALKGLSRTEAVRLLGDEGIEQEVAGRLHARGGGNPFFLRQLGAISRVASADGSRTSAELRLPRAVNDLIGMQLSAASPTCREVLGAASVTGRDFDSVAIAAAGSFEGELVAEALEEAANAGFVTGLSGSPTSFRFCHELVRDHLHEALSARLRAEYHARLTDEFARRHRLSGRPAPAVIAHHALNALPFGNPTPAVAWLQRAADSARQQFAYEEAAAHLERALGVLEHMPDREPEHLCDTLLALSEDRLRAGDRPGAGESCARLVELSRQLKLPEYLARAALSMTPGFFSIETARFDPTLISLLNEALDANDPRDKGVRIRLLGRLATALYWSDNFQWRERLSAEAMDLLDDETDDETIAYALYARHCALWAPENVIERVALATQAAERTRAPALAEANLLYRTMLITDLAEVGDFDALRREVSEYSGIASELGQAQSLWLAPMFRNMQALAEGRFKDAEKLSSELRSIGDRVQSEDATNAWAGQLMMARFEMGDGDSVLPLLRQHIQEHPRILLFRAALVWFSAELGSVGQANDDLSEFWAKRFRNVPRDMNWLGTLSFLALGVAELRQRDASEQLAAMLAHYAERFAVLGHGTVCLGSVACHLSRLCAISGDWHASTRYFEMGLRMNELARAKPWTARTLFDRAQELRRRGESFDSDALLDQAKKLAAALGMRHLQRRIQHEEARSLGETEAG